MNHRCGVQEDELGPFLLGHLDEDQAAAIAERIAACPSCSSEVAQLRAVVATMAEGSPPDEVAAVVSPTGADTPPMSAAPEGLANVLTAVRRERLGLRPRRRRFVALGAVAVAAAVTAISVGSIAWPTAPDREVVMARQGSVGDAAASATLDGRPWGTAITLQAQGLEPGETYGVWLERREGGRLPAGSFSPSDDGTVTLQLTSGLALADSGAVGVALLPGGVTSEAVDVLAASLD